MKKMISLLGILGLVGCSSGGSPMKMSSFYEIPMGATQEEVVSSIGKPYAVRHLAEGEVEYEYIERFKAGGRDLNERHYFIRIKEGKVISKKVEQQSPLPYGFDSYEMQTTQGNESPPSDPEQGT